MVASASSATGNLDKENLRTLLNSLPAGRFELVCHPGYNDAALGAVATRLRQPRGRACRTDGADPRSPARRPGQTPHVCRSIAAAGYCWGVAEISRMAPDNIKSETVLSFALGHVARNPE